MHALCTDIGAHVKLCKKVLALNICVYANYSYTCNKRSATCSVEAEKSKKKFNLSGRTHTYMHMYIHIDALAYFWVVMYELGKHYLQWQLITKHDYH